MSAIHLNKLRKAFDKMHILSDFPGTPLDRIEMDIADGLSQAESIDDQIREYEDKLEQIESEVINLNKI